MRLRSALVFVLMGAATVSSSYGYAQQISSSTQGCARPPPFARKYGISDPTISTAHRIGTGLLLLAMSADGTVQKQLQLPAWKRVGRLGAFVLNEEGDIFVVPVPNVNTLENPPEQQNWIYRIAGSSGELSVLAKIPVDNLPSQRNPYGLLGLDYDCKRKILYASTISGSLPKIERGKIVAINSRSGKLLSELHNIDSIAVGTGEEDGMPFLYAGHARSSSVFRFPLKSDGTFTSTNADLPSSEIFKIDSFGVLRARKIRVSSDAMSVYATEFYFNLVAQTEFEQPLLRYHRQSGRWLPRSNS